MNALSTLKSKYEHKEVEGMTAFHHPQYRSRMIYLDTGGKLIRFTRPDKVFKDWAQLDADNFFTGAVPQEEVISKFFTVDVAVPPPGAMPFQELLKHCESIIHRHCIKFERGRHYELNYDDLRCIAYLKVHEEWIAYGNKPLVELEKIISTSVWNKFSSLLGKHFQTQSRDCGEMCSITENNENYMPVEYDSEYVAQDERDQLDDRLIADGWGQIHRDIIKQLVDPHPILKADLRVQTMRHERARQSGARQARPSLDLTKLSLVLPYPQEVIATAYQELTKHYKI